MAYNCIEEVFKALNKDVKPGEKPVISQKEVEAIVQRMNTEKQLAFISGVTNPDSEFRTRAMEIVNRFRNEVQVSRMKAQDQILKRQAAVVKIGSYATPEEGLEAMMVGIQKRIGANRDSISARQINSMQALMGDLAGKLEASGVQKIAESGALDRETRIEWSELNKKDGKPGITGNKEALAYAQVLQRAQKLVLRTLNDSGAYIRELDGYAGRMTHDPIALAKSGKEEWVKTILPLLDQEKTFRSGLIEADPAEFLSNVYDDIVAGKSSRKSQVDATSDELFRLVDTPANIAKRAEKSRVLHFKDASAEHDYIQMFGEQKNLLEQMHGLIRRSSKDAGLMGVLGPNPEATFQVLLRHYNLADKPFAKDNLVNWMKELQGETLRPGESMVAKVGMGLRVLQATSKLGSSVINSLGDLATRGAQMSNSLGVNQIEGTFQAFTTFVEKTFDKESRDAIMHLTGVAADAHMQEIVHTLGGGASQPGMMSKFQRLFYKMNLQTPWTEINKQAHAAVHAAEMGLRAPKEYGALDQSFQRNLKRYGMDAPHWDIARSAAREAKDGRTYIGFGDIHDLPTEQVRSIMERHGMMPDGVSAKQADRLAEKFRTETATKLSVYYGDQAGAEAMLEPTAKERGYLLRGSSADTFTGQAIRLWAQFKMFPTSMVTQVVGGTMYAKGAQNIGEAFVGPTANKMGMGMLMANLGVFAYLGMAVNDVIRNKTPRSLKEADTWKEMLQKGGTGGLYADYLLGDYQSRQGRGLLRQIAGPTIGQLDDVGDLITGYREAMMEGKKAPNKAAGKLLMNNLPMANHFAVKAALSYSLLYNMNEKMNPGYIARMEARMRKEGQQFIVKPGR